MHLGSACYEEHRRTHRSQSANDDIDGIETMRCEADLAALSRVPLRTKQQLEADACQDRRRSMVKRFAESLTRQIGSI